MGDKMPGSIIYRRDSIKTQCDFISAMQNTFRASAKKAREDEEAARQARVDNLKAAVIRSIEAAFDIVKCSTDLDKVDRANLFKEVIEHVQKKTELFATQAYVDAILERLPEGRIFMLPWYIAICDLFF